MNQNKAQLEGLITITSPDNQVIAVVRLLVGEQKYQIYTLSPMGQDEVVRLLENKPDQKI